MKKRLILVLVLIFAIAVMSVNLTVNAGKFNEEETNVEKLVDFSYLKEGGGAGDVLTKGNYTVTPSLNGGKDDGASSTLTGFGEATVWVRDFLDIGSFGGETLPTKNSNSYDTLRVVFFIEQADIEKIINIQIKLSVGINTTTLSYVIHKAQFTPGWNTVDLALSAPSGVAKAGVTAPSYESLKEDLAAAKFQHMEIVVPFNELSTQEAKASLKFDDIYVLKLGEEKYIEIMDGRGLTTPAPYSGQTVTDAGKNGGFAHVMKGTGDATIWIRNNFVLGSYAGEVLPKEFASEYKYGKLSFYTSDVDSVNGFNVKLGYDDNNAIIYLVSKDDTWKTGWNEIVFDLTDKTKMSKAVIGGKETEEFDTVLNIFKTKIFSHLEIVGFLLGTGVENELRLDGLALFSSDAQEITIPQIDVSSLPNSGTFSEMNIVEINTTEIKASSYSGAVLVPEIKVFKDGTDITGTLVSGIKNLSTEEDDGTYLITVKATDAYGQVNLEKIELIMKYGLKPSINSSMLQTSYDVYGETMDLTVVEMEVKEDTSKNVARKFEVTNPDGVKSLLETEYLKFTKAGKWTIKMTATSGNYSVSEEVEVMVGSSISEEEEKKEVIIDFSKKGNVTTETYNGIKADWGVGGVTILAQQTLSENSFWLSGGNISSNTSGSLTQFKLSDYGSLILKYSGATQSSLLTRMSITFNTSYATGAGADFYGFMKYLELPKLVAGAEGGEIIIDLSTFNASGAKNETANKTVSVNDLLSQVEVVVWISGAANDTVKFESLTLNTAKYAPSLTLKEDEIQEILYKTTSSTAIDMTPYFDVIHNYGLTFSTSVGVTLFKNGETRSIEVTDNKFFIYESGTYKVLITAIDENGGKVSKSFNIKVTGEDIDKVPPTIETKDFKTLYSKIGTIDLSKITATDNVSESSKITLSYKITSPDGTEVSLNANKTSFEATKNGTYSVVVSAVDEAGNPTSKVIKVIMNDSSLTDVEKDDSKKCGGTVLNFGLFLSLSMILLACTSLKLRKNKN